MPASPVEFSRLTSGQNSTDDPCFIGDSQSQVFQNLRAHASGKVKSRGGSDNFNTTQFETHVSGDTDRVNAAAVIKDLEIDGMHSKSLLVAVNSGRVKLSNDGDTAGVSPGYRAGMGYAVEAGTTDIDVCPATDQGPIPLASICPGPDLTGSLQNIMVQPTPGYQLREIIVAGNNGNIDNSHSGTWRRHAGIVLETPKSGSYAASARKWGIARPLDASFAVAKNSGSASAGQGCVADVLMTGEHAGTGGPTPYLKCTSPATWGGMDNDPPASSFSYIQAPFIDKATGAGVYVVVNTTQDLTAVITGIDEETGCVYHDGAITWQLGDEFSIVRAFQYLYFYRRVMSSDLVLREYKMYGDGLGEVVTPPSEHGQYLPDVNDLFKVVCDSAHNPTPILFKANGCEIDCFTNITVPYTRDRQVTHICIARKDPGLDYFQVVGWVENDYTLAGKKFSFDTETNRIVIGSAVKGITSEATGTCKAIADGYIWITDIVNGPGDVPFADDEVVKQVSAPTSTVTIRDTGATATTVNFVDYCPLLDSPPEVLDGSFLPYGLRAMPPFGGQEADCYGGSLLNIYGHTVLKYPSAGGGFNVVFGNEYFPNRIWWTQGGAILSNHHVFLENDYFDLPYNGDTTVAGCFCNGALYLFQQRHTWRILFDVSIDEANPDANLVMISAQNVSEKSTQYGCMSPRGVAVYGGYMIVVTHEGVMAFDGETYHSPALGLPIEDTLDLDNLSTAQMVCIDKKIYLVTKALYDAHKIAVGKFIDFDDKGCSWSIDLTNELDIQCIASMLPAGENIYYQAGETGVERGLSKAIIMGLHGGQSTYTYAAVYDDPDVNTDFTFSKTGGFFDAVENLSCILRLKRLGDLQHKLRLRHMSIYCELLDVDALLTVLVYGDINKSVEIKSVRSDMSRATSGEPFQVRYPTGSLATPAIGGIDGGSLGQGIDPNSLLMDYTQAVYQYGIGPGNAKFLDFEFRYSGSTPIIINRVLAMFNVRSL